MDLTRKELEHGIANVIHSVHGGGDSPCFLCKLDARAVVSLLVTQGVALLVQAADAVGS